MSSIFDLVARLVNNIKQQTFGTRSSTQEQLSLSESGENSSNTSSQNELIDLNSTSSQANSNHLYYAITEQQEPTDTVQNLEMNIGNNEIDALQRPSRLNQTLANMRLFRRASRRSNRRSSSSQLFLTTSCTREPSNSIALLANSAQTNVNDYFSVYKKRERNLLSAICAIFAISILSVSLVDTRWFFLQGGGCNLNYIGVAHFFAPGRLEYHIETSKISKNNIYIYNFILPNGIVLRSCANREIIIIMRTVIAFIFLAIFSSCIGLMLDTFGFMKSGIKLLRRHAIFHILTVIFCLAINGFCFWISERIYYQQNETREKNGKKIDVSFDVSYYLVVLASALSIMATAFTLVRRYPSDEDDQIERLLEEYTNLEESMHVERSLPANSLPNNPENPSENQQVPIQIRAASSQRSPPTPPSTPPPPLHTNIIYQPFSISEPPPPYAPVNA